MTTTIKKLFALLTALCLVLCMVSCGKTPVKVVEISLPETFEMTVGGAVDPIAEANFWTDREDLSEEALAEAVAALALTWTTEDESVAFIDANGALCAAGEGETELTVTTEDGSLTVTANVVVHAEQEAPADEEVTEGEPETEPVDAGSEADTEVDEVEVSPEDVSEADDDVADSKPVSAPVADSKPAAPSAPESVPESTGTGTSEPAQENCPTCGATDHTVHPTQDIPQENLPDSSNDDVQCQTCGATDHTVHPTCPTCGATDHTVHPAPTCPTCGSTDHTTHPTAPAVSCPSCGSSEHTVHPEADPNRVLDVEVGTGFEAEGNGGNAEWSEIP